MKFRKYYWANSYVCRSKNRKIDRGREGGLFYRFFRNVNCFLFCFNIYNLVKADIWKCLKRCLGVKGFFIHISQLLTQWTIINSGFSLSNRFLLDTMLSMHVPVETFYVMMTFELCFAQTGYFEWAEDCKISKILLLTKSNKVLDMFSLFFTVSQLYFV